ncbi:hypothetical protein B296_00057904 [Ensete ventricosum]|uniref:Calmodulin-binding domain-containing protein n=1 Tax=Ensete ventricosum TaxID=4639 RepID=A0A426X3I3_ENSVE|nr:hypothetical protein B296_00057904 [Ensete ventricosum]
MSEERAMISVNSEDDKKKGVATTNSTGKPHTIALPSSSKNDEKLLPHYMRPSTGSCHDFCKYGIKHVYDKEKGAATTNSTGKPHTIALPPSSKSDEKLLPHYMRPSTGSSHDFCKYGIKHVHDGKHGQSNFMTQRQSRQTLRLKKSSVHATDELTNKTALIEQTDLPSEKIIRVPDSPTNPAGGSAHEFSILDHNAGLQDQINDPSLDHPVANKDEKAFDDSVHPAAEVQESTYRSCGLFRELVTARLERQRMQNDVANEEHLAMAQVGGSCEEPVRIKFMLSSAIQKGVAASEYKSRDPSEGLSVKQASIELIIATPITDNTASAEYQTSKGTDKSYDKLIEVKMKRLPGPSEGPLSLTPKNYTSKASAECRPVIRAEVSSEEVPIMNLKTPAIQKSTASATHKPTDPARLKSLSSGDKTKIEGNKLKNQKGNFGLNERNMIATEFNPDKLYLKTMKQKLRKHKPCPDRIGESEECGRKMSGENEPNLHREVMQRTYRGVPESTVKSRLGSASVNSGDGVATPHKLNLSRGKMINLHSENISPKRLRFRQVKMMGGNQNAEGKQMRSSIKRVETDGAESDTSPGEATNVVLRHQDVQDKRDTQSLLNHVIKETASKLLEARKSKVKALADAFETVINLQESQVAAPQ